MIDLPRPLAVVCHDAGGTSLILPWLTAVGLDDVRPVMTGPAAALWAERFGDAPATGSLGNALDGAATLLSGTGWASDEEHRARALARARGIPSIAVLDHWVQYRERFLRGGEEVLPDAIWVTDEHALALARAAVPGVNVLQMPNLYLAEQVALIPRLGAQDGDVLFVAEPVRSDWGRGTPGEFQALDYFLDRRSAAGIPLDAPIRLRPHPSDEPGKYDGWASSHPEVMLDRSAGLAAALAPARWVAGCQSYALIVAHAAGRETISALPPWAPPCPLPEPGIRRLATL